MLAAAFGFALMGVLVKIGAQKFTHIELVFYRSLFGFLAIASFAMLRKRPLASPVLAMQLSRAAIGFIALALFFYAIAHLPLATAVTLNYTSPLFLALLAPWLLREKPAKWLKLAVVGGFVGMVSLLKPSFAGQQGLAASFGLLSGVFAAFAYVHVKQLGNLHEPEWRTVFYFTLLCSLASGLWMLLDRSAQLPTRQDLPILLGLGVTATLSQMAMTRAYKTGDTLVVGSFAYMTVVFASLFGVWFWQERLSAEEWVAIACIVLSGLLALQSAPKTSKQPKTP